MKTICRFKSHYYLVWLVFAPVFLFVAAPKLAASANKPPSVPTDIAYRSAISSNSRDLKKCFADLGESLHNANTEDPGWNAKVTATLARMNTLAKRARRIKAPTKYKKHRQAYVLALSETDDVVRLLPESLERKDIVGVRAVLRHMNLARVYLSVADSEIGVK